jgi:pSer/pThr/pTyr-binding forkhead associated (FHA) protein
MAKLILSLDGLLLKEIPLAKERTTIGRKPHNDIQIDNLAISGEHAVILTLINDSFLEDLNSTNGTFVNGQAVKKHFLQDGDVIELGKYHLKYLGEGAQKSTQADFEKTMVLRPDMMRKTVEQAAARGFGETQPGQPVGEGMAPPTLPPSGVTSTQPQAAREATQMPAEGANPAQAAPQPQAAPPKAMIQVLNGANAGRELELTKTLTTLGKPGVQVAVIARRPHGYFITHVEGVSFPSVSGQMLEANKPHQLNDHDVIEIGGTKMEFFFKA